MAGVPSRGLDRPETELGELPGCARQVWGIKIGMSEGLTLGDKHCRMNVGSDSVLSWNLAGLRWPRGEFEGGCEMRLTLGHQSRNLIEHD